MSKPIAFKHYVRALKRWPRDALRPECQFKDIVRKRVEGTYLPMMTTRSSTISENENGRGNNQKSELEQVNALYLLLENHFSKRDFPQVFNLLIDSLQYPLKGSLMKPASNPNYYSDLVSELEAAPTRGFWDRFLKKIKGMLRFS